MSFYRNQLEDWLKEIDVKADRVLDIGGSAYPVTKRVKSWEVKEYKILDNNNEQGLHEKWQKPDFVMHIDNVGFDSEKVGVHDVVFCDIYHRKARAGKKVSSRI